MTLNMPANFSLSIRTQHLFLATLFIVISFHCTKKHLFAIQLFALFLLWIFFFIISILVYLYILDDCGNSSIILIFSDTMYHFIISRNFIRISLQPSLSNPRVSQEIRALYLTFFLLFLEREREILRTINPGFNYSSRQQRSRIRASGLLAVEQLTCLCSCASLRRN